MLISTRWLAEHLGDEKIRLVDMRWSPDDFSYGERGYARGHLPGAVYLGPGARLTAPEHFRQSMEEAGIDDTTAVIAYDDGGPFHAARLVWALHYVGHPAAYVLNGGVRAWCREGRSVETKVVVPPPGRLNLTVRPELRATKADVLRVLSERANTQIVDCRRDRSWEKARQHIPGARRLPSPAAFTAAGTWKSPDALRCVAAEAGLTLDRPVVLYCGGGVSAACVFVMLRVLGADHVAVYDASWREWGSDPTTPKARH
jgi:thiosulfate/3-mercaptopyruvate sulfurtransferase